MVHPRRRRHESGHVSGRNEDAVLIRPVDHLGDPTLPGGDHRQTARHRLGQNERRSLVALCRKEERIGRGEERRHLLRRLRACEDDSIIEPEIGR